MGRLLKAFGLLRYRKVQVALAALVLVLTPASLLYFWDDARSVVWTSLGFGYAPVGLWIAAFLLTLKFGRKWVTAYPSAWLAAALGVVATLGFLSLFVPSQGALDEIGLSGYWGRLLGGYPLPLGIAKVAAALLAILLIVAPRWSVAQCQAGVEATSRGAVAAYLYLAARARELPRLVPRRPQPAAAEGEAVPATSNGHSMEAFDATDMAPVGQDYVMEPFNGAAVHDRPLETAQAESKWVLPGLELLTVGETEVLDKGILDEMSSRIEETLSDHGVEVSVTDVRTGPRVIRFGLVPGRIKRNRDAKALDEKTHVDMGRVKVQSILARETDLALALKTSDLRIESPVPGESFVGLEVPNPKPSSVFLRSIITNPDFREIVKKNGLPVALGQDTGGNPLVTNLVSLPHLLIAGSTGSGKSVCINTVVASFLMSIPPDRLRMLMVDPKRVELTPFNGIPHLFAPVIVDTDEVTEVLEALLREMFARYKLMEEIGARNIDGYNRKAKEPMPYAVLIIDELADLMMISGFEVEQALVRLAQLGRAAGIHLILCTQRPSVKVVTGLLKANVPGRIAFAVASQVDSRVILDGAGADKLLGKGDMLFLSAQSPAPLRIQGAYLSDSELEALIDFWKSQKGPPLSQMSMEAEAEDEEEDDEDKLLDKARQMAGKYQQMSPSLLQRHLEIGYPRAMQLLDILEEEGIVAGGEPGKSRQVLKSPSRAGSFSGGF